MKNLALQDRYFPYDEKNYLVLDKLAGLDPVAAREIIESWEFTSCKARGYVVLSKHLSNQEAAVMLSSARRECWNISDYIMIYEEEKRRDLFQAKETLWAIFSKLESHQPRYGLIWMAEAGDEVVIDKASCLHVGVDDLGSDKGHPPVFKIF